VILEVWAEEMVFMLEDVEWLQQFVVVCLASQLLLHSINS
jgi:hypothetical protein